MVPEPGGDARCVSRGSPERPSASGPMRLSADELNRLNRGGGGGRAWAPEAPRNLRRGDDLTATGPGEPPDPAVVSDDVPFTPRHARRLAISTAIFSFATAISRVLGLIREIVPKNYFGVAGQVNA